VNIEKNGVTPLCTVILNSPLEVLEALLESKANIEMKIPREICPPHKTSRPMKEIVEALLKAKANPGNRPLSRHDDKYTVLHFAKVCATDWEKCEVLVQKARHDIKKPSVTRDFSWGSKMPKGSDVSYAVVTEYNFFE